jgi:DNA-binding transcriptional MerR regulator
MNREHLADTGAIACLTGRPEATIRAWAREGALLRRGTEGKRALYSVREATELAQQRSLDNHPDQEQH